MIFPRSSLTIAVMEKNFSKIREELGRRYEEALSANKLLFLTYTQRYFDFIEKIPSLKAIVLDDRKHRGEKIEDKTDKGLDFMFWPLYRYMPEIIDRLNKKEGFGAPPICRTKFQKILKWLGLEKTESDRLVPQCKVYLRIFHTQLLDKIVDLEFDHSDIVVPSEVVKTLGLTPESKWEDLTIIFTHEFEVRIRNKDKIEFKTTHKRMGFADERRKNSTEAVASWRLLQLLAVQDGKVVLSSLKPKDRERRNKQKQDLSAILKSYFQIQGDPFFKTNKEVAEYSIKIKLVPLPEFREQWRDRNIFDSDKPIRLKPQEFLKSTSDL